jgi:NAD-dependent dihydropyrimidine dehydrogenase PreA subunit
MKEVLIVDGEKCTGCGICELICSMEKMGEYNPRKSYIKLLRNRELDINMITLDPRCDFCNKCVEWCPAGVLKFASWEEAAIIRKENKLGIYPAPSLKGS